jgi:hypothetical protein
MKIQFFDTEDEDKVKIIASNNRAMKPVLLLAGNFFLI